MTKKSTIWGKAVSRQLMIDAIGDPGTWQDVLKKAGTQFKALRAVSGGALAHVGTIRRVKRRVTKKKRK